MFTCIFFFDFKWSWLYYLTANSTSAWKLLTSPPWFILKYTNPVLRFWIVPVRPPRLHQKKTLIFHPAALSSNGEPWLRSTCLFCAAGTLKLMDSSAQLLWSVQVDHQLFALQKLDVTVGWCCLSLLTCFSQYFFFSRVCTCASACRGTAGRRWWRAPGTARPTSSTTTAPWCASSLTRTSTPSAQVKLSRLQLEARDAVMCLLHVAHVGKG